MSNFQGNAGREGKGNLGTLGKNTGRPRPYSIQQQRSIVKKFTLDFMGGKLTEVFKKWYNGSLQN